MEPISNLGLGARRDQDIALDLLKFVAATTGAGKHTGGAAGFAGAPAPKAEEQIDQLLELYSRCLKAVEGKGE